MTPGMDIMGISGGVVPSPNGRIAFGSVSRGFSDARAAWLLADEGRHRIIDRLFGVPRDQSWIVTVIALGVLAKVAHDTAAPLLDGPDAWPSLAGTVSAASVLNELVSRPIGGPGPTAMPFFGAIVAGAMIVGLSRPLSATLIRRMRTSAGRMRAFLALGSRPSP